MPFFGKLPSTTYGDFFTEKSPSPGFLYKNCHHRANFEKSARDGRLGHDSKSALHVKILLFEDCIISRGVKTDKMYLLWIPFLEKLRTYFSMRPPPPLYADVRIWRLFARPPLPPKMRTYYLHDPIL